MARLVRFGGGFRLIRALRSAQARRVTQYVVPVVFPRINPLNLRLLHSRLHPLLSWYVLVFCFEGRRTGRQYEVPATYRRAPDGALEVLTSTRRGWWQNLDGNAGVTILYRGAIALGARRGGAYRRRGPCRSAREGDTAGVGVA